MKNDRAAKLETTDMEAVKEFVEKNGPLLETAELSVRSSAGVYIAQLRPTDEPSI